MTVPNSPPRVDPGAFRLALVGESPGLEEASWRRCRSGHYFAGEAWEDGRHFLRDYCPQCSSRDWVPAPTPFVGPSGRLLGALLHDLELPRERLFFGNVCQEMATGALLEGPDYPPLVAGLAQLRTDLEAFRPNCVLLLGASALRAFHPGGWERGDKREFCVKITDWRGSIFAGRPELPWKCVAAFHPAHCLRQPEWTPLLRFDLERAVAEAKSPALDLPERHAEWGLEAAELCARLGALRGKRLGFDIEGYPTTGMTDCSFADSPTHALWVPFRRVDGSPWWSPSDAEQIMAAVTNLLQDEGTPKVMHNALYELFALKWGHGIELRGIGGDTMLLWHEAYCEMDKALEVVASIVGRQPYWKFGRHAQTEEERARYNCIDSMVTLEVEQALLGGGHLTPGQLAHYQHRLALLAPTAWQMARGFRFDQEARAQRVAELRRNVYALQGELDEAAGVVAPALADVVAAVCNKNKVKLVAGWSDVATYANKKWREEA